MTPASHTEARPLSSCSDLTIVVAFSGSQAAHAVAAGHVLPAIVAFTFSIFAIVWAWLNYTWFASAFDNDDWVMRLATLVQMVGVVVLSLGLADIYKGFDHWQLNNRRFALRSKPLKPAPQLAGTAGSGPGRTGAAPAEGVARRAVSRARPSEVAARRRVFMVLLGSWVVP